MVKLNNLIASAPVPAQHRHGLESIYTYTIDKTVSYIFQTLINTWSRMEIGPTRTLNSQVGGHAGVLTTEDGSLLIKPALPRELDIYQKLRYDPLLEALWPFTVNFLGTLKLEGEVDQSNPTTANGGIAFKPIDDHKDECFP